MRIIIRIVYCFVMERNCPVCGEAFEGRIDKIFCSPYCKSANQYKKSKEKEIGLFRKIDNQLKSNRRILAKYNKAGMSIVRKAILLDEGFNPNYFTNYWKNDKGEVYLFCYEYGFLAKVEKGMPKYILVQWQKYMEEK